MDNLTKVVSRKNAAADSLPTICSNAYNYMCPLVIMDLTRLVMTKGKESNTNKFVHVRSFPQGNYKDVVRPNFDTLYSTAWLDLRREPIVLSLPATDGRYHIVTLLDMWTDVFASPGKRTSGSAPKSFVLVPTGWIGQLPPNLTVIEAPTVFVWAVGRIQVKGVEDYAAVHKMQDQTKITLLSEWIGGKKPSTTAEDGIEDNRHELSDLPPLIQLLSMSGKDFFVYASKLLNFHKPHLTDWSILQTLKDIGIELKTDDDFCWDNLDPEIQTALEDAKSESIGCMKKFYRNAGDLVNGWLMFKGNIGVYGNDYFKRALIAVMGLAANEPIDSVYPILLRDSEGILLNATKSYNLRFKEGELPPNGAFWSLTVYDATGFTVPNQQNRYALHSWDNFQFDDEGSLTVFLQHDEPDRKYASNWLPTPEEGYFNVTMRIYMPESTILTELWKPPPAIRISETYLMQSKL